MPHFMPMQEWLCGLAQTGGQILLGVAVLRLCYRVFRFTARQPKR